LSDGRKKEIYQDVRFFHGAIQWFIEAKADRSGGDNWTTGAISRAKLQSNHHRKQTNIQFFLQAGYPSNSVKALKGKYHIPWTCLPQAHLGVFQLCL